MAQSKASNGASEKAARVNIHIDVDQEFHRELKMICAYKSTKLRDYAIDALRAKLTNDQRNIKEEKSR